MLAAAIIISILLLLMLLRIGIIVQYNEAGFAIWLKVAFLKLNIDLDKKRPERKDKRKIKLGDIKPGSLREFTDMLRVIKEILRRIRLRLLIKKLVLHYISAGDDPAKVALGFGAANAVYSTLIPMLERNFRIKRRDLRASADFDAKESKIYVLLNISLAVWEGFYILAALIPLFTKLTAQYEGNKGIEGNKGKIDIQERKDNLDGKGTDK